MNTHTLTFIGAGNLASSLIVGLVNTGYPARNLWVSDPDADKRESLTQRFGIHNTADNNEAVGHADVVILAVKPQVIKAVCLPLAPTLQASSPLVISVAAGVPTRHLQRWLGESLPMVRCLPNIPALVQCAATALYATASTTQPKKDLAESILRAVGITLWVDDESQLDIVTALSGSGPAYLLLIMEALQAGAERLGLPAEVANLLTLQTALGTSKLALESTLSLAALRAQVTSPGGTTEKALSVLEKAKLSQTLQDALEAATQRAKALADLADSSA